MATNEGPEPDLKERARELRRQGLSLPQIAAELGGKSTSTVQDWVRGVPPPAWTRRPQAKDAERARARELREQGLTYDEIARELGVSKSSVSLWTRDLPHPESSADGSARLAGLRRYFETRREREDLARSTFIHLVTDRMGPWSERDLLIAGAVAYWAEGAKRKPWRSSERVTFTNSDADMIRLFLAFLRLMDVAPERVQLRVAIHESADEEQARSFWGEVTGVSANAFQKSTLKRHVVPTVRKNVGADYHGCLVVTVLKSSTLYRQIEGIWFGARTAGTTSLLERSRVV